MPLDLTLPRTCLYSDGLISTSTCPGCAGPLQQSRQVYVVQTRSRSKVVEQFEMGAEFGWFCEACPTVVIDKSGVEFFLRAANGLPAGGELCVLGIQLTKDRSGDPTTGLPAVPERELIPFKSSVKARPMTPAGESALARAAAKRERRRLGRSS